MTVREAEERLLSFFLQSDYFEEGVDFDNVIDPESITRATDKECFKVALKQLAETKVIVKASKGLWLLASKLDQQTQTVEIGYPLAVQMTQLINNFSRASGNGDVADPRAIGANYVVALIQIIQHLAENGDSSKN